MQKNFKYFERDLFAKWESYGINKYHIFIISKSDEEFIKHCHHGTNEIITTEKDSTFQTKKS